MHFSLLTVLASATLALAQNQYQDAYSDVSFDLADNRAVKWMKDIPDNTPLHHLSIPGTHNSLTHKTNNELATYQNTNLKEQLNGGIRYLDINCRLAEDRLQIIHASFNTSYDLNYVLTTAYEFLEENPSEALIMHIQKDIWRAGSDRDFQAAFTRYMVPSEVEDEFSAIAEKSVHRIYSEEDRVREVPNLGNLRGQILILQDFDTKPKGRFGIRWKSSAMTVTDWKVLLGPITKGIKWNFVWPNIQFAGMEKENKLHIIHTSMAVGSIPYRVAAGKKKEFRGMNGRLSNYLNGGTVLRTGIVVMDFPGKTLVNQILKRNLVLHPDRVEADSSENTV
ncbi:hypothetical protein BROUX41_004601 [Berkeleyomyces rouxiae]